MYWRYFHYKLQGVPCVGFPLPVLGNVLMIKKALETKNDYTWTLLEEFWFLGFGIRLPPMFSAFGNAKGMLIVNDPEIVSELYHAKNKYLEKSSKFKRQMSDGFIGESILFSPSDDLWALKRKRIGSAFYKDKLNAMLKTIIGLADA